MYLIDEELLFL